MRHNRRVMSEHPLFAAVDIGSNSFRLEIARPDESGRFKRVEYHKEAVRQGAGLDADGKLSPEAMQRGWDCLARFATHIAGFAPPQVRAVATQTLREARNRDDFLAPAQRILGFPIEVISGHEEARLIYRGATQMLPPSGERRLVLDIGGRSTELIVGSGDTPRAMESYRIGSVAWSMRYFPDGRLSARNFEYAHVAAQAVLDGALRSHGPDQWDAAYGCSGTVGAIADALLAAGRTPARHLITRDGLRWMRKRLVQTRRIDDIDLPGIKPERKPVIAGGLAVLYALCDLLQIDHLSYIWGGLRRGVLHELLSASADQPVAADH
jgi:exopolyphosphatase/guanosine-5'-triphosphate,3'-diphosphate pyrophosphatase